jgi:hypothetical protein
MTPGEEEKSLAVLEHVEITDARTLKNAVARCLLEDGGAKALIKAMTDHLTEGSLVTSCLRALFYIGDTQELVTTMVGAAGAGLGGSLGPSLCFSALQQRRVTAGVWGSIACRVPGLYRSRSCSWCPR